MQKKVLYVTMIGAPNVGKSSLINALTNFYACSVSPKGHTTKESIYAILNIDECQIIFIDTPGLSKERTGKFAKYNSIVHAEAKIKNNLLMFLFECHRPFPSHMLGVIHEYENRHKIPVLTKSDKRHHNNDIKIIDHIKGYFDEIFATSVISGEGLTNLINYFKSVAIEAPWPYSEEFKTTIDQTTLIRNRIREALFEYLYNEIPHQTGIEFTIEKNNMFYVTLYCNESQKKIILPRIKNISQLARYKVQEIIGHKIHLFTNVSIRSPHAKTI